MADGHIVAAAGSNLRLWYDGNQQGVSGKSTVAIRSLWGQLNTRDFSAHLQELHKAEMKMTKMSISPARGKMESFSSKINAHGGFKTNCTLYVGRSVYRNWSNETYFLTFAGVCSICKVDVNVGLPASESYRDVHVQETLESRWEIGVLYPASTSV